MKINVVLSIIGTVLFAAPFCGSVYAQCTDVLPTTGATTTDQMAQLYKFEDKKILNEKDKKKEPSTKERQFSAVTVNLTTDIKFKVALDSEVTSGFAKFNDLVPFSVLQNVYLNVTVPGLDGKDIEKRCVAIPKGAKIYGVVDKAKPSYPFYFRGKSRIAVLVQQLLLDSSESIIKGDPVEISFVEPNIIGPLRGRKQKAIVRDCQVHDGGKCVVGRRTKITLPSNLLSPAAEGYLFAKGDDGTNVLGWVTGLKALGDLGFSDLTNPPKAVLNSGMIFEVQVTKAQRIWIPVGAKKEGDK